jgi:hypothetical protein
MKIALKKPIVAGEGDAKKTITELDLSKLDDLTVNDLLFVENEAGPFPSAIGVGNGTYRLHLVARASGVAFDLLKQMSAKDEARVRKVVMDFFDDTDSSETEGETTKK